jgi:hypothetical protein
MFMTFNDSAETFEYLRMTETNSNYIHNKINAGSFGKPLKPVTSALSIRFLCQR